MEAHFNDAKVCRFGCDDNGLPNIVPVSFGYRDGVIYFPSAHEGRKITLLQENPACMGVLPDKKPCKWEMHYRSVICTGRVHFITNPGEKHYGAELYYASLWC
jgi:nitroimidazol reductase NimA-like FMN-containing flavoprotein (pyridoxamine 5'-phosphate oxidase superfamily)